MLYEYLFLVRDRCGTLASQIVLLVQVDACFRRGCTVSFFLMDELRWCTHKSKVVRMFIILSMFHNIVSKALCNFLTVIFHLSVCFRMVRPRYQALDFEEYSYHGKTFTDELRSSISQQVFWNAWWNNAMIKEHVCHFYIGVVVNIFIGRVWLKYSPLITMTWGFFLCVKMN